MSSSTSRPGCRGSGPDWCGRPSSSSWWRSRCMSDTPACRTTSITRPTWWWGCCRELSSPLSLWVPPLVSMCRHFHSALSPHLNPPSVLLRSGTCPTSSSSAPLPARGRTRRRWNTWNANRVRSPPTRSRGTTTATPDPYELLAAAAATLTNLRLQLSTSSSVTKGPVTCTELN